MADDACTEASTDLGVLSSSQPVLLSPPPLEGEPVTLPLQHDGSHQPLDLGGLEPLFLALLQRERSPNDVLAHVVVLGQVEKLPDLAGSLGPESPGDGVVGQPGDLGVSLLDDGQVEDGQVTVNNATAHGLALTLSLKHRNVTTGFNGFDIMKRLKLKVVFQAGNYSYNTNTDSHCASVCSSCGPP